MYIQQIYTNCLAHAAYYIECDGEAAIIDPLRNPAPYLEMARQRNARIKYVMETHFHADFVSGHIDLADKTGATIVFGPGATPGYKAYIAADGEDLKLGSNTIKVLHTPGHTIESVCYLLLDNDGNPSAVFTGDTLFAGDVGRPDLLSGNLPKEELAGMLYESLKNRIKTLPDAVVVYPGHGAGSACGKNIGPSTYTTIGEQRQQNYAMQLTDKNAFVKAVTTGQPDIPAYFFKDAALNINGAGAFDEVLQRSCRPIAAAAIAALLRSGCIVLDTRNPMDFAAGYIPGAINVGLNGDFAVWVGTLLHADKPLLLVADEGKEPEAIERLARIGFDNVQGFLDGGMTTWFDGDMPYDTILTFTSSECKALVATGDYQLLDVRNRREVARDRIAGAMHIPLSQLAQRYKELDVNGKWLIYCAGGYRSMVAASYLQGRGFHFVASVEGGMNAIRTQAPELVELGMETE